MIMMGSHVQTAGKGPAVSHSLYYLQAVSKQTASGVPCLMPWLADGTKPTSCSYSAPVQCIVN